jgi:hypothetical protein
MELKLILLQFCAHLLADFIFQPQSWSDQKCKKVFSAYHFYHASIVGGLAFLFSLDLQFWYAAIAIAVVHLFTDGFKSWLQIKNPAKPYFFFDQLIHICAILLISLAYSYWHGIMFIFKPETRTVAIFTGFILCTKPANILIKYLFIAFSIAIPDEGSINDDEKSLPNAGKLIGIAERTLTFALIIMLQYQAVGLIIAAKSILRLSGTQKTEYVLVGTLLSFAIAIFSGIIINLI